MKKSCYLCLALASPSGGMVDTLVSGASASRHVGSSPISGTLDSAFSWVFFILGNSPSMFYGKCLYLGDLITLAMKLTYLYQTPSIEEIFIEGSMPLCLSSLELDVMGENDIFDEEF